VRNPDSSRIAIALGCVVLAFVLVLAGPAVAGPKQRSQDRVPRQLWKTYPFDPSHGKAQLRKGTEADRQQAAQPPAVDTTTTGPETRGAEGQPSDVDDRSSEMRILALFAVSLVGLFVLVVVLRSVAVMARNLPSPLMRFRPGVPSRLRSSATPPPRKLARGSRLPIASRHRAVSHSPALRWSRLMPRLSASVKRLGTRTAGAGAAAVRAPVRVGAPFGAGLRWAAVGIFSKRGEILIYFMVILTGIAIGVGVSLLLSNA
jgi:hypothetical protein